MGTCLRKMCLDVNTLLLSLITRMTSVYLMQNKDEVPDLFKRCHKHVKCLLPKFEFYALRMEMNILQKDVYMSIWGSNWGPNLLLLYSIEWNSRSTSIRMNVPKKYHLESILTTAYIINRLPMCLLGGNSPLETFTPKPNSFLVPPKVFGCNCFVHMLRPKCKDPNPGSLLNWFSCFSRIHNSSDLGF